MIEELRIEALAYGGNGVGRHDGKAVFVPFAAPGDLVRCRIVRDKKRYAEAELVQVLSPAATQREPPCPVFRRCGGCQWQHLPYEEQCRWKERIFADTLVRQAGADGAMVRSLLPAPDEWGYRNRVQFKCRLIEGGFIVGFFRRGSHFVIDVEHCPITAPLLNDALKLFRGWLPDCPCPEHIPQVDMAVDDERKVRIVVHCIGEATDALRSYLGNLAEGAGYSLFLQSGRKETLESVCGEEDLHILPNDKGRLRLAYGPGGFAQVNLEQNRRLVEEVVATARLSGKERVLDLYCGMGNFSLPLAQWAGEVVGVEDYLPSIVKARENAQLNGLKNARFHARPAEGAAVDLTGAEGFDLVLLDPPRTGAYGVTRDLLTVRPDRILYISCDPPTLGRDLKPLLHGGYDLLWSRPFDLFPQTYHTESVTLLERRS